MDDVRVPEVDHRVAVGVGRVHMVGVDLLAVEVERHGVGEGHDRQGRLWSRGDRLVERLHELIDAHPLADVLVRDDQRARLAEVLVAARVVAVPVGVEHEADRPVADLRDRGHDLLGQRRVLVVDQEDAVRAGRDADVATPAHQHVDAVGDLDRLDLDVLHVLLSRRRSGQRQRQHESESTEMSGAHPASCVGRDHPHDSISSEQPSGVAG